MYFYINCELNEFDLHLKVFVFLQLSNLLLHSHYRHLHVFVCQYSALLQNGQEINQ